MRVAVATPDVVGARMAGPGIRAWHLAHELSRHFETVLIGQVKDPVDSPFPVLDLRSVRGRNTLNAAAVVVGQPFREVLSLPRRRLKVIYDLFDPVVLELRELYGESPTLRQSLHYNREWGRLRMALSQGDALIHAAPRQLDFYAGVHLSSGGRDTDWRRRWVCVPFGIEREPPPEGPAAEPPEILWGGGRWEWLDPATAIEATRAVNQAGTRCRLVFLGGTRPNDELAGTVGIARSVTANDFVVENPDWVPYGERWKWLRRSRAAIMLHRDTIEAEFSIRTRIFDAIWAGLPVIATTGGYAAELVEREGLGITVSPGNEREVAAAITRMIQDDAFHAECSANLGRLRPQFYWSEVARPLVEKIASWR